jgi:hypothetical protein
MPERATTRCATARSPAANEEIELRRRLQSRRGNFGRRSMGLSNRKMEDCGGDPRESERLVLEG